MQYVQAIVTTSQTAKVTAIALWDRFFTHYGFAASICSDQGQILKVVSLKNYVIWVAFENSTQPLIIHREMGIANDSILP